MPRGERKARDILPLPAVCPSAATEKRAYSPVRAMRFASSLVDGSDS